MASEERRRLRRMNLAWRPEVSKLSAHPIDTPNSDFIEHLRRDCLAR
jgi:hypothetical protein